MGDRNINNILRIVSQLFRFCYTINLIIFLKWLLLFITPKLYIVMD